MCSDTHRAEQPLAAPRTSSGASLEAPPRDPTPGPTRSQLDAIRARLEADAQALWERIRWRQLDLSSPVDRALVLAYGHAEKAVIHVGEALRAPRGSSW